MELQLTGKESGWWIVSHENKLWLPKGELPQGNAANWSLQGATAQQIDGQPFDLTAWRARNPGKATLLYFWAEWCPVCKTTAGNITNISNDWPVMTIATQSGSAAQVASYMQKNNYRWPTVNDPKAEILRQFGLPGTPAFVIITPAGEIQFVSIGFTSEIGLRLRLWWASRESS